MCHTPIMGVDISVYVISYIEDIINMKETVLDLKKYGYNSVTNMLLIAMYISYGGPIIIKYKSQDKPKIVFFDHDGNECYWIFGEKHIDIDTALIKLFSMMERNDIESFTFFIDDLNSLFGTSEINRKQYIKDTYEDTELDMNRQHLTYTRKEFVKLIINKENKNIGDFKEITNLFNINK